MVLFIIKESLWNKNASMLKYVKQGDKVLFIQDGVLILNNSSSETIEELKEKKAEVLALKEDLELRGIKNNANIKTIDYYGFVDLIESNKVFS